MPSDLPPPAIVVKVDASVATGPSAPLVLLQDPQKPVQIPQVDLAVEVVGELPLQVKVRDLTRLLGLRHRATATSFSARRYQPTILELITLVKRNPAKPRGRAWNSIGALTIRYDPEPRHVIVEYCLDACDFDPRTGGFNPRRKMVSYRAAEDVVEQRLDKKLKELQKYEPSPARPQF